MGRWDNPEPLVTDGRTTDSDPMAGDARGAAIMGAAQELNAQSEETPLNDALEQNLANTVTVPPANPSESGNTPGRAQSLVFATFKKSQRATLMLQSSGSGVLVILRTIIAGRATFVRQWPLSQTNVPRTLAIFGKSFDISVASFSNNASVTVIGALITEEVDEIGELWPTWQPFTGGINSRQVVVTQAGIFLGAQGSLVNGTANTSYWMMFFDAAALPNNGTVPLVAIGPMVGGVASSFAFDRSLRPDIVFNTGLTWALSTTPDVLTNVVDSSGARVDLDWGI